MLTLKLYDKKEEEKRALQEELHALHCNIELCHALISEQHDYILTLSDRIRELEKSTRTSTR